MCQNRRTINQAKENIRMLATSEILYVPKKKNHLINIHHVLLFNKSKGISKYWLKMTAFITVSWCTEIFLGNQPRSSRVKNQHFRDLLTPSIMNMMLLPNRHTVLSSHHPHFTSKTWCLTCRVTPNLLIILHSLLINLTIKGLVLLCNWEL
jgi:hypothetical protein